MANTELDLLIAQLRRRCWTQYLWGPAHDLALVAWVCRYGDHTADVILLRGEGDDQCQKVNGATGYRRPTAPGDEPWNPPLVMWQYHSTAARTLRAVITLPHPREADAPRHPELPEKNCMMPVGLPHPRIVRPLGIPSSMVPTG